MNEWIEEYKKFHTEASVNDIHISDLISDTKSENILQYNGEYIEGKFDGICICDTIRNFTKRTTSRSFK